jgi:hypothetical protein
MLSVERALLLRLIGVSVSESMDLDDFSGEIPDLTILDGLDLVRLKQAYSSQNEVVLSIVDGLLKEADALLRLCPVSVIDKHQCGRSSQVVTQRNDYVSLAPYWWPNGTDGSYIRQDGKINPEAGCDSYDSKRLELLTESLQTLAVAAYITGQSKYAIAASAWLNQWFVNPESRQNPNLNNAQLIVGKPLPNIFGIIEGRNYIWIVESIKILEALDFDLDLDISSLKQWYLEFFEWILSDDLFNKFSGNISNNIAFWYDLQCISYARFTDQSDLARDIIKTMSLPRIIEQVSTDGSMPAELIRQKPYDYTAFAMVAITGISSASEKLDMPLWNNQTAAGRCLSAAQDWLLSLPENMDMLETLGRASPLAGETDSSHSYYSNLIKKVSILRLKVMSELREDLSNKDKQLQKLTGKVARLERSIEKYKISPLHVVKKLLRKDSFSKIKEKIMGNRQLLDVRFLENFDVYSLNGDSYGFLEDLENKLALQSNKTGIDQLWILHKIVDDSVLLAIKELLKQRKLDWLVIPFEESQYLKHQFDDKNDSPLSTLRSDEIRALSQDQRKRFVYEMYSDKARYFDYSELLLPPSTKRYKSIVVCPYDAVYEKAVFEKVSQIIERSPNRLRTNLPVADSRGRIRLLEVLQSSAKNAQLSLYHRPVSGDMVHAIDIIENQLYASTSDNLGLPSKYLDLNGSLEASMSINDELSKIDSFLNERTLEHSTRVAFVISLKSKKISKDWGTVGLNLSKTLKSILASTVNNFHIVVVGSERPDIVELTDDRVHWQSSNNPPPTSVKKYPADKMLKRRHGLAHLHCINFEGYVVACDADDWIHHRFVEYLQKIPLSDNIIFASGIMLNARSSELWIEEEHFFRGCGTSTCFYFKNSDLPSIPESKPDLNSPYFFTLASHARIDKILGDNAVTKISHPLVVWLIGHSENVSDEMGKKNQSVSAMHYSRQGFKRSNALGGKFKIN